LPAILGDSVYLVNRIASKLAPTRSVFGFFIRCFQLLHSLIDQLALVRILLGELGHFLGQLFAFGGGLLGCASPSGEGGLDPSKVASVEEKMGPVIKQLLGQNK
jgi:hypothetical protein